MPGIIDKLKGGAEKASFEADRLRRLTRAQSELKALQQQLAVAQSALGQQALTLYDSGSLTQPEMLATCRQAVDPLRLQITIQQAKIQQIREEKPPETVSAAYHGHICPCCQIQLPSGAGYCPRCGSKAVDIAPPQSTATAKCARCGALLAAEAVFCTNCGAHVEVAAPKRRTCSSCSVSIPVEAVFCPNCGASLSAPVLAVEDPAKQQDQPGEVGESICPVCGASPPAEVTFCPNCGAWLNALAPEPEEPARSQDQPDEVGGVVCQTCGMSLPVEAAFCPNCGTTLTTPASAVEEPETTQAGVSGEGEPVCLACGMSLPVEATFCPRCGEPIASGQAGTTPTEL